jgi:hypothetical protein
MRIFLSFAGKLILRRGRDDVAEREKKKKSNFFTTNNNNGIPSQNRENLYAIEENSDWESLRRKYRGRIY